MSKKLIFIGGLFLFCLMIIIGLIGLIINYYLYGRFILCYDESCLVFETPRVMDDAFFLAYLDVSSDDYHKLELQVNDYILPLSDEPLNETTIQKIVKEGYATEQFPESLMSRFVPYKYFSSQGCSLKKLTLTGKNATIVLLISNEQKIWKVFSGPPSGVLFHENLEIKLKCNGMMFPFPLRKQDVIASFGMPHETEWFPPPL